MSEFSYIDPFQLLSAPFQGNNICKIRTFESMFMPMIYFRSKMLNIYCFILALLHFTFIFLADIQLNFCCNTTSCNGLSQYLLIRMANYGRNAGRFQNRISNII